MFDRIESDVPASGGRYNGFDADSDASNVDDSERIDRNN